MPTFTPKARWTPIRSPEALGRTIRRAREQTGLTQAELAVRARATRQAIITLEGGHETRAVELIFDALATLGLELAIHPRER
jgi:transcriptional regulator with XRE-family HTH domain